jgi:oligoendopeptidase F
MEQVLTRVAPELGRMFSRMRQHDLLDLSSRKGKMPGGEEWFFPITNLPYIHLNAVGSTDDILTLLHECGHAFHDVMSATQQSLVWNMGAPAEFSEFAAMSMTMLALPYLHQQRGGWLPEDQVNRMERGYLESVFVKWLPLAAMVDAFQHWVYTEAPQDLTAADLDAKWVELGERFQPVVDWSTLEGERASGWQQMRLLFSQPFYFIEYAFAHLGALTLWRNALDNPNATWQAYRHALTLGDTRPLAALFEAAGVQLLFDPAFVCETMEFVTTYLDQQNV